MPISTSQEFGALTVCLWLNDWSGEMPDDTWYCLSVTPEDYPYLYQGAYLCLKETNPDPNAPLLLPPVSFATIGSLPGTGEYVWRPVAPDGYRAFTDVIATMDLDPNDNPVCFRFSGCVREGQHSDGHTYVHTNAPAVQMTRGGLEDFWAVTVPQYTGDSDAILLSGGLSLIYSPGGEPVDAPVQNLLSLPPAVVEGPPPSPPTMDSYDEPAGSTPASTDRTVLVPCTAIQDGTTLDWQLANSPYYTVIRQRCFTLAMYCDNQYGSSTQTPSKDLTYGVSDSQSQTFSSSVGVTVGFETGVDIFVAEAKVSASLSVNLGYASSTSVTDMQSVTYNQPLTVDAGQAGAVYNETHTIDVLRQDGTSASSTGPLTFDAYSSVYYVSYPPPQGEAVQIGTQEAR